MASFLTVVYRVDKKDDLASIAGRVAQALESAGQTPAISFRFADAPAGLGSGGGIERLLKAYPEFGAYHRDGEVANLGKPHPGIGLERLLEVARGVPRRFGFHQASLFFEAPILDEAPEEAPSLEGARTGGPRQLRRVISTPGITVISNWWTPKRMNGLTATAKLRQPGQVAPELRRLLDNLGKKQSQDEFVLPSSPADAEQSAAKSSAADMAFERGKAAFRDRVLALPLETLIQHGVTRPGESLPLRERVAKALKALGYRSVAAHAAGILRFVKTVDGNRDLVIDIDRGTWSKTCTASIEIRTLEWSRRSALPISTDAGVRQYPLLDETQVTHIASNLALIVQAFEQLVYDPVARALDSE